MPADFERQSALVLGANELLPHHPQVLTKLVSTLIDRLPLVAFTSDEESRRELVVSLSDWGLPAHRIHCVRAPAVGRWVRDYGPTFVRDDGRVCVIDAGPESAGSPHSDSELFPAAFARLLGADLRRLPLTFEGGQALSNGKGLVMCSTALLERNAVYRTTNDVLSAISGEFGFRTVACVPPLAGGPAGGVDLFATFTSANMVVLGRFDPRDDAGNAQLLDRAEASLRGLDSGAGPLQVVRIPMPPHTDNGWRSYTNVIYANDVVLVPKYARVDRGLEREAHDTLRHLLPDRQIIPIEATTLAVARGGLRGVTLNIPDLGHEVVLGRGAE